MEKVLSLISALFVFGILGAQNVVFHENFEQPSGADSVVAASNSSTNNWGISTKLSSGGLQSDSARIDTSDNKLDTLTLTTNTISTAGNVYVTLEFDHICKIESFDNGIIEVSTDNGTTWTKLDSTHYMGNSTNFGPNGNKFSATAYGGDWAAGSSIAPDNSWWKHEKFDMSSIAGNSANVTVRFSLIDDNNSTLFEN